MTSTKNKVGEGGGGNNSFLGKGFFSVTCKHFLHLYGCLVLHSFLEASSTCSSVTETKEVQSLIMKVGSINVCIYIPASFIILTKLVNIVRFSKKDSCI